MSVSFNFRMNAPITVRIFLEILGNDVFVFLLSFEFWAILVKMSHTPKKERYAGLKG